jgi:hypothetical protein
MKILKAYSFASALFGSALVAKYVDLREWTVGLPEWVYVAILGVGAGVYLLLDNWED